MAKTGKIFRKTYQNKCTDEYKQMKKTDEEIVHFMIHFVYV